MGGNTSTFSDNRRLKRFGGFIVDPSDVVAIVFGAEPFSYGMTPRERDNASPERLAVATQKRAEVLLADGRLLYVIEADAELLLAEILPVEALA